MLGRKKTGMRDAFDEFINTLSTAEKTDALEDTSVETSQTAAFFLSRTSKNGDSYKRCNTHT